MGKLEDALGEFVKRHTPLMVIGGLVLAWLSLYFVTKTEADQKYARKDDVQLIRSDIQELRGDIKALLRGK